MGTVSTGIATSVLNIGIKACDYVSPAGVAEAELTSLVQPAAMLIFFAVMMWGSQLLDGIIEFVLMLFYKEKKEEKI